jgi:hypothetical protein
MSERTEGDDTCPDCGGVTPCPLDCTGSTGPADAPRKLMLALKVDDYLNRCTVYGPSDALRDSWRELLREIHADSAGPAAAPTTRIIAEMRYAAKDRTHDDAVRAAMLAWADRLEAVAGPADAPKATCETNGHIYGVGAVCVFCGAPRPENPPHGPVSEKFMRHYYGASGAGPADAGSHERLIELEKRIRPKHEYCSSNGESLCRDQKLPEARSCSGCNRWRWADELKAIIAASASAPAARPHFRCSEGCGVVAVDEDGCCRTCGADAVASAPAVPRETTKEEKADMSPGSTT